jgi:ATP-binding protein involved in chromosome partitioning
VGSLIDVKKARTYSQVPGGTASDIGGQLAARARRLERRLSDVRRTVAIMSGKGGVGKSVVTANLATALAADGLSVGVLDADLNGPSMAKLLGVGDSPLAVGEESVEPAIGAGGVKVMSMGLLLQTAETPVTWSGPRSDTFLWRGSLEMNALREFLADTAWGRLDYLLLDLPPGADRIASIHDLLPNLGGAIAITLPSELSREIVSKSLNMARELGVPVIGYVENMSGYLCPHCNEVGPTFVTEREGFDGVPLLATLPFDPRFGGETDAGRPDAARGPDSLTGRAVREIAASVKRFFEDDES